MKQFTGANELLNGLAGEFDTHSHVFHRKLPMLEHRRYTPVRDAMPCELSKHIENHNLSGGFLVQPSFLGTDNGFLLKTLEQTRKKGGPVYRGIVVVNPSTPVYKLRKYQDAGVIGIRLNLVGQESEFRYEDWKPLLTRVDELGWHVELHARGASLNHLLTRLSKLCSTLVVDHFGLPDPKSPLNCEGYKTILNTKTGRLFVKMSAPYRAFPNASESERIRLSAQLVKSLADSIGPARLLWGSDWPWTQNESNRRYSETIDWLRNWTSLIQ